MGLKPAQWISVTSGQYNAIPKGNNYYPDGIFVKNNDTSEVDQISGGQRHWVSPQAQVQIILAGTPIAVIGADQFNVIPRSSDYVPPATTAPSSTTKA